MTASAERTSERPAVDSAAHRALTKARQELAALVESAAAAAAAYGRPDLADRLARASLRSADRGLDVLVVGEFKQGKSTLVNALLNAPVCGVADDVSTVIPTTVRYGVEPAATVRFQPGADGVLPPDRDVPIADVPTLATEQGNPGNRAGIASIEVAIPRKLLLPGLALVDTPGVGGLDSTHGAATAAALAVAEVIVFVSDASQPLTSSELDFLRGSCGQCATVLLVQPKIDIQPDWRRVVAANRELIEREGLDVEVFPVSSLLRQQATAAQSTELNDESGYPPLLTRLRDATAGDAARRLLRTALADVMFVIEQLRATFESKLAVLEDPGSAADVVSRLETAKDRADRLRSQSAKWQQTLNDGMQDLTSDMDHDLRLRFRALLTEGDAALEGDDPGSIWEDFEQWLHTRLGFEISRHHQLAAARANELAALVAEHFAEDEEAVGGSLDLAPPTIQARLLKDDLDLRRAGLSGNALAAVRGSYGGLLMFGMVGQLAGFAMLNPLSLVIGLGLGRRGLREEKRRQLLQRQQQAKMTVRKYVDDISLEASKTSRDTLRRAHRELRDEFAARAEQLQATIRDSLRDAEVTMKEAIADRQRAISDARAELERIARLDTRAASIDALLGRTGR